MRTLCAAVLLALTACGGGEPEADIAADDGPVADVAHNTLTPAETDAGWILLFDGVSTDGWRGYLSESFPERGWAVEDGNLVVFASDGSEEGLGGVRTSLCLHGLPLPRLADRSGELGETAL